MKIALLAGALSLTSAVDATAAKGEEIKALYNISFMGFGIAKASLAVKVDRGAYAAKLHISTSGLARIVSSEETYVNSKGYVGRSMMSSSYDLMSRGDKITQVDMSLSSGNIRSLKAIPELAERDDRVPVTNAAKRNVVDPLSAAMVPVSGKVGKAVCDRTLPVFDGWTRYDIKLSYSGTEAADVPGYKGDAVKCDARWIPVAGHRSGSKSTEFMTNNRDISVWFVPMAGGDVMVPSKVSVKTMRGVLLIQAAQFGDAAPGGKAVAQADN
ncbi:DUF3108 domain-containing protein [Oryzibacter oryziterrae]|uniref:DUF3108 domain-containing protein n=1 Tax=Oryzibacter oryziterrae TaxID=2766474 RepID=UPI001F3D67CC|nr:DUF3108 domain-containing protein [Oryzibacter oryziterrae]